MTSAAETPDFAKVERLCSQGNSFTAVTRENVPLQLANKRRIDPVQSSSSCFLRFKPVSTRPFLPGLEWAHPITQEWFIQRFGTPTEPQMEGWPSIQAGQATLISAPTGSARRWRPFWFALTNCCAKRLLERCRRIPKWCTFRR